VKLSSLVSRAPLGKAQERLGGVAPAPQKLLLGLQEAVLEAFGLAYLVSCWPRPGRARPRSGRGRSHPRKPPPQPATVDSRHFSAMLDIRL
jgi:hypothetical protein